MKLSAHGIEVTLPPLWSGRIFARAGGNATLHAGDFRLALGDGEFGDASTAQMPPGSAFVALVEYLPGAGLEPGRGLYAPKTDPAAPRSDRVRAAQPGPHPARPGGDPGVLHRRRPADVPVRRDRRRGDRLVRRRQLAVLDRVLGSLRVVPPGATTSLPV